MVFGFGDSRSPWEKADASVENIFKCSRQSNSTSFSTKNLQLPLGSLYEILKPEPAQMSLIGAGFIGGKAESVRQAINSSSNALDACAAAEPDGMLKREHVDHVLQRIDKDLYLLLDGLNRISAVYYDRFCELGMGLPRVVKVALVWIESSTKNWLDCLRRVNGCPELVEQISSLQDKLLTALAKALQIYSGIKT